MSTESTGTHWLGGPPNNLPLMPVRDVRRRRGVVALALVAAVLVAGCGGGDGKRALDGSTAVADTERGQEPDGAEAAGAPAEPSPGPAADAGGSPGDADICALVPEAQLTAVGHGELQDGQPTSVAYGELCIFDPQDDVGSSVYVTLVDPGRAFYEDLQVQDPDGEAVSVGSEAMMWIGDFASSIGVMADDALIHIDVQHGHPRPSSDEVRIALLGAAEAALVRL